MLGGIWSGWGNVLEELYSMEMISIFFSFGDSCIVLEELYSMEMEN